MSKVFHHPAGAPGDQGPCPLAGCENARVPDGPGQLQFLQIVFLKQRRPVVHAAVYKRGGIRGTPPPRLSYPAVGAVVAGVLVPAPTDGWLFLLHRPFQSRMSWVVARLNPALVAGDRTLVPSAQ